VFTYFAVAVNGTSHEYHRRMRDGQDVGQIMRATLGGQLEYIPVAATGLAMWCDEDGAMKGLVVNAAGPRLVTRLGGRAHPWAGPLLVTGSRRDLIVSLNDQQVTTLLTHLKFCR
jgi:hypothetical protein